MMESTRFVFFLFAGLLHKGIAVMVETQHTRIAEIGKDVQLSCQFLEIYGVQQVTWQKVLGSTAVDISSYNLLGGEKVYPPFTDKVQFAYSGLKDNSITVKNITEQDVGCYLCLFTAYPLGNVTAETCLRFNELHGPFMVVRKSKIPPGSLVTCSATGQPAPTVTLIVYQKTLRFSHDSIRSTTNTNGTVTITITALLSPVDSTHIGCLVEVDFTDSRELMVIIPGVITISGDESGEQSQVSIWTMTFVLLMLLLCICLSWLRRRYENRKDKVSQLGADEEMRRRSSFHKLRTSEKQRQNSESHP